MAELAGADVMAASTVTTVGSGPAQLGRAARTWSVFTLSLVALLAAIDRQSFAVLLVPIQKDLHVSDAAMGALTGSAFAIVYAVIALPLARLADRTNRRNLLALAVAIWSAATAACGLSSSFVQLLMARIAVGSAESVQLPASLSLIGDMFPAQRRGTAISFMIIGSALGFALGAALAGALNDHFNWHATMMIVGLPGLVLAAVMFLTVREPPRGLQDGLGVDAHHHETFITCIRRCMRIRTLYPFAIAWISLQMCFLGWLTWMPAFLMRVHHLSSTKMGAIFGAIIACATFASLLGGPLSDFLAKRGARWRLYYCCCAAALSVPVLAASTLVPTLGQCIACLVAYTLLSGGITAVGTAIYVSFAPPTMRGFLSAIMNLSSVLLGSGIAPFVFGAVNDVLKLSYGDQSLRYTLLLAPVMLAIAGVFFALSSRTVDQDVAAAGRPVIDV
ncbi:MAG TPA: MFS transporter [Caulobacteraceae bacterium]|jgi:MFS family permease